MSVVAHQGELEFDGAFWDDQSGWRVRWRIVPAPGSQDKANPMKRFTKRRGDRSGTRFMGSFQPVAFGKPYAGEVMLAGWADSTAGWSVTLEHGDAPDFVHGCLRRTKDRTGTRYMVALAEVDDEDNVINQQQRERVETAQREGKRLLLLSNRAALLTKANLFHEWLRETVNPGDWTELGADKWLKRYLGIESKADLDDKRNTAAITKFGKITSQFEQWREDSGHYR